jgi:hypothetical protein
MFNTVEVDPSGRAVYRAPHTFRFTFIFNCVGQTVPSLLGLACERFYHIRAVKPEEYRVIEKGGRV